MLEKGENHTKKKEDVLDPPVMDPNNPIEKAKIEVTMAYITVI